MIASDVDTKAPAVDPRVIEWLERLFPDRAPELKSSLDEIRFKSGCVHVVRKLRAEYEEQTKNALERTK